MYNKAKGIGNRGYALKIVSCSLMEGDMATKVKNLNGTSDRSAPEGYRSWLHFWEESMGRKAGDCQGRETGGQGREKQQGQPIHAESRQSRIGQDAERQKPRQSQQQGQQQVSRRQQQQGQGGGGCVVPGDREIRRPAPGRDQGGDSLRVDHGRLLQVLHLLHRALHARPGNFAAIRRRAG